ncbi:MAG TPA: cytochrome c [Albitalea sp.]|nr:cytochrome c [Albitalea sp.]
MKTLALLLAASLCMALAGCEREMHDMYAQPRYDPNEASPLFADGRATRAPPAGSVAAAMGELAATSSGRHGREPLAARDAAEAASAPVAMTAALLQRGRERYTIYCVPCHSPLGDGDGPITRRGFPHPPSYHEQRLREAPDRQFFDVITQGHGIMVSYADRVTPEDRWAIVAYIRALQLSQNAPLAALPPSVRDGLPASAATPASGAR